MLQHATKMCTYYEMILNAIPNNDPFTIHMLMEWLNVPDTKLVYVISGIKKGMREQTIKQLYEPTEKRKYLGHRYQRV